LWWGWWGGADGIQKRARKTRNFWGKLKLNKKRFKGRGKLFQGKENKDLGRNDQGKNIEKGR